MEFNLLQKKQLLLELVSMGSYTLINIVVIIGTRLRYVTRQSTGLVDFRQKSRPYNM